MSLRPMLAAVAVLAFAAQAAAPAAAQEPGSPAAAPAQDDEAKSPELAAAEARVEAAGEEIKAVLESLEPQAAAIRTDAALSDTEKATRIGALLDPHRGKIDAFGAALEALIMLEAAGEDVPPEVMAGAAAQVRQTVAQAIEGALISGDIGDDQEDGEDDDGEPAPAA
jgi:hypothetical protein